MLRFLRIRRLAVVDAVEVEFAPGLNVLTGETGAGKSILVEAVDLLLGGRASADLVRTGEEAATVEAVFERPGGEMLVRREVTAQGRSRAFVDGELVTAAGLRERTADRIELHGQHAHHELLDASSHLAVVDEFAGLGGLRQPVEEAFAGWTTAAEAAVAARRLEATRAERQELVAFQLGELDRAELKPGEDEELAAARRVLAGSERVRTLCEQSRAMLYERDGSILGDLAAVWRQVDELAAIDPSFAAYLEARDSIKAQLEDLAAYLRDYAVKIDASPASLQRVEDRLALLERLKRKYGPDLSSVIARRDRLRDEAADLENAQERAGSLAADAARARGAFLTAAGALSEARRRSLPDLVARVQRELADLAMEQARVEVRLSAHADDESRWSGAGIDEAQFFVSPNPGEELRPLVRVASGGELSRFMLALKTLAAVRSPADASSPGLIFDEVDAGIGGRVADVVGRKLQQLGRRTQVLCITHLPQIAAYADAHFRVGKSVAAGRTIVRVHRLDDAASRVEEIGRMLGGGVTTAAIRASAEELLARRAGPGESESKPKGESESRRRRAR